jgi:DNA repair protein RadD
VTFTLRPYQTEMISATRNHMASGVKSILCQAATGAGKTALAAFMLGTAQARGKRCLFLVHRRELVKQSAQTFENVGVPYGVIAPSFTPPVGSYLYGSHARIYVGSVQTVVRRLRALASDAPFDMIVWDEAHHCSAGMWKKIRAAYPNAFHVGLTATPWRLDGTGLRDYFEVMVQGPPVSWLIANNFLAPYEMYGPPGISTRGIKTEMGDYARAELQRAADKPTITGNIIQYYLRHAKGKRALGFGVSVEHSKHVVQQFILRGIPAAHVDAETLPDVRDGIFADLASGKLLVVFNVDLAGEGFDCPAVEAVILARPTQSLTMYLQQVGRALRMSPGKEKAIILDHAGNWAEHGLPDKERAWSLDGRDKRAKAAGEDEQGFATKQCKKCFRVQHTFAKVCQFCGTAFDVRAREVAIDEDGELVRVGGSPEMVTFDGPAAPAPVRPRTVDTMSEDELVKMFEAKGYPRPRLLARDIVIQRKLKQGLAFGGRS